MLSMVSILVFYLKTDTEDRRLRRRFPVASSAATLHGRVVTSTAEICTARVRAEVCKPRLKRPRAPVGVMDPRGESRFHILSAKVSIGRGLVRARECLAASDTMRRESAGSSARVSATDGRVLSNGRSRQTRSMAAARVIRVPPQALKSAGGPMKVSVRRQRE